MQSPKAAQAASQAGKTLWQAYVQQRGNVGLSLPSSKSLWDVVNRRLFEAHGAEAVRDIWVEVRCPSAACCLLMATPPLSVQGGGVGDERGQQQ